MTHIPYKFHPVPNGSGIGKGTVPRPLKITGCWDTARISLDPAALKSKVTYRRRVLYSLYKGTQRNGMFPTNIGHDLSSLLTGYQES